MNFIVSFFKTHKKARRFFVDILPFIYYTIFFGIVIFAIPLYFLKFRFDYFYNHMGFVIPLYVLFGALIHIGFKEIYAFVEKIDVICKIEETFALISKICKQSHCAKDSQQSIFRDYVWNIYQVSGISINSFSDTLDDDAEEKAFRTAMKMNFEDRKTFVLSLYQYAIAEDGIDNNEWYTLKFIVERLFNSKWQSYFDEKFSPLRSEFDAEEPTHASNKKQPADALVTYFAQLGLETTATPQQIHQAYHRLALQHHPDLLKNADRREECEQLMAQINNAYKQLI